MNKAIFSLVITLVPCILLAQTKTPVKPVSKTATVLPATNILKSLADSAGYALGVDVASSLQSQNMTKINRSLINKSMNDILDGKPSLIDENSCFLILNDYATRMTEAKAKAGTKPVAATPVKASPTTSKSALKTLADSAGYALGVNIASSLKLQDMNDINRVLITQGLNDVLNGKTALIKKTEAYAVLVSYSNKVAQEKASAIILEGQAFLEKNKLRPEIKTTASGLQYEVIIEGTGNKPTALDTFVCHYRGSLIDGTEFESSYTSGQPLIYPVGRMITGWIEGLQLMGIGAKYKFYIPYDLAYGLRGNPPVIPGGAALIFEMELLDVKKRM